MDYEYTVKITRINNDGSEENICYDSSKVEDSFMQLVGRGLRMVEKDKHLQEEMQELIEEQEGDTEDSNSHPVEGDCNGCGSDHDPEVCPYLDIV